MKKTWKASLLLVPLSVLMLLFLCAFTTFRDEQGIGNANVVSYHTPVKKGGAVWSRSFLASGPTSYNSIPVLTDTAVYVVNSDVLYKLDHKGNILGQITLGAKMNSVCYMLLEGNKLYIPLSGGRMECVDIDAMLSVWQSRSLGGQSLSTTFYHGGYLYAGATTVTNRGTTGVFYCLNAADGSVVWTYEDNEHPGGYYWSGGIVRDNALYFCGDNGILVSHDLLTDRIYDTYPLSGKIRAGITFDPATDAMYTADTDGMLYKIRTSGQKIEHAESVSLAEHASGINCTSTPTVYRGRIYIGYAANGSGMVSVLDAVQMKEIYHVQGFPNAEIKSSPLVSTRGQTDGTVYVYVSANVFPGGIYCFSDSPTAVSASLETLFAPTETPQFCISSITAGSDGTLYYSNDSGTLFAVRETEPDGPAQNTAPPAASPAPQRTAAPSRQDTVAIKPKKPGSVRIRKRKKKIRITWKKKTKDSQTIVSWKYGSHKWKKKIVKKKAYLTIGKKKGKLRVKLASRKKYKGTWYYSQDTKTFLFQ